MSLRCLTMFASRNIISICLYFAATVATHSFSHAQPPASVLDGIFSEAQAQRGAEHYRARCASCHSADLRGNSNSPSLLGISFMFVWEGRSLGELFQKMRTAMPTDAPGSLPAQAYADLLAFILASNEFPAGDDDLPADRSLLNGISITSQ